MRLLCKGIILAVALISFCSLLNFSNAGILEDTYTPVSLNQVLENPKNFEDIKIKFNIIFNKLESIDMPFYTHFSREEFIPFSGWDLSAKLWVLEDRVKSHPLMFLDKSNKDFLPILIGAEQYTQFEVKGTVENTYNNLPWIRVKAIKKISDKKVTNKVLHYIIAGLESAKNNMTEEGIKSLLKAIDDDNPDNVNAYVYKSVAKLFYSLKDYDSVLKYCDYSSDYSDEDDEVQALYDSASENLALLSKTKVKETPKVEPKVEEVSLEQKLEASMQKLKELEKIIYEKEKEIAALNEALEVQKGNVEKAMLELHAVSDELTKTKAEKETITATLKTINSQLDKHIVAHEEFAKEKLNQINSLNEENKQLKEDLARANQRIKELELTMKKAGLFESEPVQKKDEPKTPEPAKKEEPKTVEPVKKEAKPKATPKENELKKPVKVDNEKIIKKEEPPKAENPTPKNDKSPKKKGDMNGDEWKEFKNGK